MRKSLLLFLVALVMPALAFAANKALSKDAYGTYRNGAGGSNENIIYVDYSAIGWEQAATASEGANFSIGLWFNTAGISTSDIANAILMRLGTGDHNNNNGAIQLMQRQDGTLTVNLGGDNTGGNTGWGHDKNSVTGANCGTAALNQWNFILMVFDSSNLKFTAYLNGTKTCEVTAPGVFGYKWADGIFAFGGYLWKGMIDEIQMYNKALSADEAAKAYTNEATSIASLTALYDFNEVKTGTTGQFVKTAGTASANPAVYKNSVFDGWWDGGVVKRASTEETAATLVNGREIGGEIVTPEPEDPEPTYCTPSGKGTTNDAVGNYFHGSRYIISVNVTDGESSITFNGSNTSIPSGPTSQNFYYDRTANVLNTAPGATITFDVNGQFHWLCQYVFVDFGKDGTFNVDKTISTLNGDLVSHTGYNPSGSAPTTNSNGETTSATGGYGDNLFKLPSFTLPANMAPGKYRVRYMLAWNKVDPCFEGTSEGHKGTMFDFYINVEGSVEPRTVAVESANTEMGSVAIQGSDELSVETADAVTVVATPAEGYAFLNWTINGAVVSTNATYTYKGTEDATLVANFGYTVAIEVSAGGTLTVTDAEGNVITDGAVVAPGTELTLDASATGDFRLASLTVNNEAVENGATVVANSALSIKAEFSDSPFSLYINANEGGYVKVCNDMDENENPAGTIYENGAALSAEATPYIYIVPDENYEINTITITGDNDTPFEYSKGDVLEDYYNVYVPESKPDAIIFFTSLLTGDLNISVQFAAKAAAIEGIDADNANAPVEYFNLQGMRVNADNLTPGIYVTRQGSKTVKVLVK